MANPHRLSAIHRLFLAKLEGIDSNEPHEIREELAREELDRVLGQGWRDEVEDAGYGMDPTGEPKEDPLFTATRDEGYHGDDVPAPDKKKKKKKPNSIMNRISMFLG